jgi:hypothetical protein
MIVETREAGQSSVCACGQPVSIPTMLEITRLEPAPIETNRPSERIWGWQHRLLLLGGTLLATAIVGGVLLHVYRRPVAPIDAIDPQAVQQTANRLSPLQTWRYWELMKQGLDRSVDLRYAEKLSIYHIWQGCAGAVALLGIALIGCGMAIDKKKRGGDGETRRQGETPPARRL